MYIKSVILDGFKSYGRRTEVNGFDKEFTAITGLNGTGKSNILDSLCFVFGITNLGCVRANSLQDLIYKSGQAGITKASVSLIFDNTDPNQCPIGYEKCREISVTRVIAVGGGNKNKYFINGKLVQAKKVQDFFCSVQLNVNNPSFLIMQGRITKVLNMKPVEILSMIEEAAGTSMYESKREATEKLLEKKDSKVRETNSLLTEEIVPRLDKLRTERTEYQEFQQICRDVEYLERIYISDRFLKHEKAVKTLEENVVKVTQRIEHCHTTIKENEEEVVRLDEEAKKIQNIIDNESGGELKEIENELNVKMKAEATALGNIKAAQSTVAQEQKKLASLEKNIAMDGKALQKKQDDMAKVQSLFESLKEADAIDAKAYEDAQKNYEAVSQGLSTNQDGQTSSLQDQLIAAREQNSSAQTKIRTADMELKHTRKVLNDKQKATQTNDAAYLKDKQLSDRLEAEINKMQESLTNSNYKKGYIEELQERRNNINTELRQIKENLDRSHAYRYRLTYRDPEPNFDRSKEKGMVGKLLSVKDPKNYLALMMTAGGSLYSYVAEDDLTSKKIIERGNLQHRATFIPINKIKAHCIPYKSIQNAQRAVGKENCQPALELITYDPYFEEVMKFVFGHTLICRDLNTAKRVTYDLARCRTVTLDGDIVDPEGTLSGGAKPTGPNVLAELAKINQLERDYEQKKLELQQVNQEIGSVEQEARQFNKFSETIELRKYEYEACKQRLAQTAFQQNQTEIDEMKEKIQSLEKELIEAREMQKSSQNQIKDIEDKISDAKGYRERELKAASEVMKKAKQKSEASHTNWKKREQEYETLSMEIAEINKSIGKAKEQIEIIMVSIEKASKEHETLLAESEGKTEDVTKLKQQLKEQKDKINSQNKEIKNILNKKEKLLKQNEEMKLEVKKRDTEATKSTNERKEIEKKMDDLTRRHPWIPEEKAHFGAKNTRYDYSKQNPEDAFKKLGVIKEKKEKMERTINTKAMAMLETQEERFQETMRKKKQVEQDKETIKHIIKKMDEKKREQVERAWKEVNANFSGIFSTLLQGADAQLKAVKQANIITGLEIKVAFNNVWKDSLGELSGGQRSLVALSLVLAMLKFSPAPLYILDEVDAALDMSHTQNIGNMLKKHFTSSQFIIVSLKDGMFNNANVLFRTRFENGVSAVSRIVNPRLAAKK